MLRVVAIAIGLLKMLLELQQTRRSGALDVLGPSARVRLFIEDGSVVFADEGTVGETLGRILVRERVLTQDQYAGAIERISELRTAGRRAKLGEVFVEMGLLTEGQVHAALAAQVQQKVMRALAWSSATFRFVESQGPLDLPERFVTVIEPLVIAALRLADRERIDELLSQARSRYAALRGDAGPGGGSMKLESIARVNAFRLPAAEDAFARSLDGGRTVGELLDAKDDVAAQHVDRGVVLAALLLTDALDLHRGPTSVRGMGVPRAAARPSGSKTSASAMIAGIDAKPSRQAPVAAPVAVPIAVPVAVAVAAPRVPPVATPATTGEVAAPDSARMPGLERMAPLLAEKAYQNGKKLVRAHRLADAVVELKRAASMYKAVEYELWARWAEARADARGEDAHAEGLRAAAELAIEQDTERGFATFVLGHLAKRRGEDALATELFARARALEPEAAAIDAWDVRLRMGEPTPASTRGEVTALAPLLTGEKVDADAKADASESESESESEAADARLGHELQERAARAAAARGRVRQDEARGGRREEKAVPTAAPRWIGPTMIAVATAGLVWIATRSAPHEGAPVTTSGATSATSGATSATTATDTGSASTASPAIDAAASSASVASAAGAVDTVEAAAKSTAVAAASAAPDASYADASAGLPSVDATRGVLVLPSAADSHRVYVDGRVAGVPPPPVVVACGRHTIKIGSQGREQVVLVPCGGSLRLAYP
jgi:hypothetical protein